MENNPWEDTWAIFSLLYDKLESLYSTFKEGFYKTEDICVTHPLIIGYYNQEIYAWYDLEDGCEDWYMDICNFWDDNYLHILFYESFLSFEAQLLEYWHQWLTLTNFQVASSW